MLKLHSPPPLPLKKSHYSFYDNPPLNFEILSSPHSFGKFGRRLNPPLSPQKKDREGGGEGVVHTMITLTLLCLIVGGESNCKLWGKSSQDH